MAVYSVEPDRRTLHGAFSRDFAPILTIDPGDTVRFRTLDADWNLAPRQSTRYDERPAQFTPRPSRQEDGHALCGPIAIRGAQPGMTLGVQINAIRPGEWGFTQVGGWPHPVHTRLGVVDIVNQIRGVHAVLPHGAVANVAQQENHIRRG
jgi:acetamidase/formamidase